MQTKTQNFENINYNFLLLFVYLHEIFSLKKNFKINDLERLNNVNDNHYH